MKRDYVSPLMEVTPIQCCTLLQDFSPVVPVPPHPEGMPGRRGVSPID